MLDLTTPFSFIVRITLGLSDVHRLLLTHCLVSGHALQAKDMSGYEPNGLAECSLLCLLGGIPVTNGISLGICAMDYRADDPYPRSNTPGLIADNVGRREEPSICLPIRSFALGHA
jgi:hypothetical protein